jgi:hypothetical protein
VREHERARVDPAPAAAQQRVDAVAKAASSSSTTSISHGVMTVSKDAAGNGAAHASASTQCTGHGQALFRGQRAQDRERVCIDGGQRKFIERDALPVHDASSDDREQRIDVERDEGLDGRRNARS